MTPIIKDLTIAREVKQSLTEKLQLYEVQLFGSLAHEGAGADSDIDLYMKTGPLSREQRLLISDVVWEIGFTNDVVISPLVVPRDPRCRNTDLSAFPTNVKL